MKQHVSHIILNSYLSSYFLKYFVCGRAPPSALCWLVSMETSRSPGDCYRGLTGGEVHYFSTVLGLLIKESPRRPLSHKPTSPPTPPPPPPGRRFDSSPFKKRSPQSKHGSSRTGALLPRQHDAFEATFLLVEKLLPLRRHVHAEGGGNKLIHFQPPADSEKKRGGALSLPAVRLCPQQNSSRTPKQASWGGFFSLPSYVLQINLCI